MAVHLSSVAQMFSQAYGRTTAVETAVGECIEQLRDVEQSAGSYRPRLSEDKSPNYNTPIPYDDRSFSPELCRACSDLVRTCVWNQTGNWRHPPGSHPQIQMQMQMQWVTNWWWPACMGDWHRLADWQTGTDWPSGHQGQGPPSCKNLEP